MSKGTRFENIKGLGKVIGPTIQDRVDRYDNLIEEIENAMNEDGKLWNEESDEWLSLKEWKETKGIDLQTHLEFLKMARKWWAFHLEDDNDRKA